MRFDPASAFAALTEHNVRFVLIGGLAARLHGSPSVTEDVDVCYARDHSNIERLARALTQLDARLRGAPGDVGFRLDAAAIEAGDHFTFTTSAGALDIFGRPAGTTGFESLAANAVAMDLDRVSVLVASVDDLIRMKTAAGRPKDLIEVEILAALREEIEGGTT